MDSHKRGNMLDYAYGYLALQEKRMLITRGVA